MAYKVGKKAALAALPLAAVLVWKAYPKRYKGIIIAPAEASCNGKQYDTDEFPYSREELLPLLTNYLMYSDRMKRDGEKVDIEHIVSRKDAWDSGACNWSRQERREFASDLLEVTLADSSVNRSKSSNDTWIPPSRTNFCVLLHRILAIKKKYELTMDPKEFDYFQEHMPACEGKV